MMHKNIKNVAGLIITKMMYYVILVLLGSILVTGCYNSSVVNFKIKVEETEGFDRSLEYVEVGLALFNTDEENHKIYVYSISDKDTICAQIIDKAFEKRAYNKEKQIVFPISIRANEVKEYIITTKPNKHIKTETDLRVFGDTLDVIVENKYFSASLKEYMGFKQERLGAGHLGNIILKEFDNLILERKNPNLKIHWSPNFGKEDLSYRTMAHMISVDSSFTSTKGPFYFKLFRRGCIKGYEKILLMGAYEFYAGLPYFIFSSDMLFTNSDTLNLLRNDEMTMDSLFTHVVFPRPNGKTVYLPLYNEDAMTYLEEQLIADDAPWLFFYNAHESYAFGSMRLHYDNKNIYGKDSPTENRHTKITASINSGRYWNRRLINSKNTFIPKGSKYSEKNAYIVFKVDKNDPAKTIEYFYKCLKNPVKVSYIN